MNKYVVAIISFFENEIKQFKVEGENEYQAVKKAMLEFSNNSKHEIEFQNSADYPKDIEGLHYYCNSGDMDFSVIEVKDF